MYAYNGPFLTCGIHTRRTRFSKAITKARCKYIILGYVETKFLNTLHTEPKQKAMSTDHFYIHQDDADETATVLPLVKRRKGCQLQEHNKDEQAISESSLNKLVGAVDVYNLEV